MKVPTRRLMLLMPLAPLQAQAPKMMRGVWSARRGANVLGGTWTAEGYSDPDAGGGTWTLMDQTGRVLMRGTWAARRAPGYWEGAWLGRVEGGSSYSGTWKAQTRLDGKLPFVELLRTAANQGANGTWTCDNGTRGTWNIRIEDAGK